MTTASDLLALGPDALYLFDETSGTTLVDSSGNGRDGTYYGSPTFGQPGLTVDSTAAVTFNGTDARAGIAYDAAWMAPTTLSVVASASVPGGFDYTTVAAIPSMFELGFFEDAAGVSGHPFFAVRTEAGQLRAEASADLVPVATGVRLAGTYDGTTIRLYVDDALAGEQAHTGTPNLLGNGLNFASWDGADFYQATIDEAAFFTRALTASELGVVIPPPAKVGLGLVLDSGAVVDVTPPLDTYTPPAGTPSTALRIVAPTVPVPTLVNGRPT